MTTLTPCVLVAPDSFKGTFRASVVAAAIGEGLEKAGVEVDQCPAADGGEGTMGALVGALGGDIHSVTVADPLGRSVTADFAILAGGEVGVVETAQASGLGRVQPSREVALSASSYGTGELIAAAIARGARRVLVTVGGSATTDGGTGAISALEATGGIGSATLEVVCDVRTQFEDAAAVFGPQKGADNATVQRLTRRLRRIASRLPRDPRGIPMTGCAGGLSGGLWARYDAKLHPGAPYVLDTLRFDRRAAAATVVVTGEGCLDDQTGHGKLVAEIARRSASVGRPTHAIVGRCDLDEPNTVALGLASVTEAQTLDQVRDLSRSLGHALGRS